MSEFEGVELDLNSGWFEGVGALLVDEARDAAQQEHRRRRACEDTEYQSLICPFDLDLMSDPVRASDGICYEREKIEKWIKGLQDEGLPIISPITRKEMSSKLTPPPPEFAKLRSRFNECGGGTSEQIPENQEDICQFMLTSTIFRDFERIRELDLLRELGLKPPQLVVLGNESHGKSTILERLIGFPVFPRARGLCTRCPIRVELRRSKDFLCTIEVRNRDNQSTLEGSRISVSLESISQEVQNKMDELCPQDRGKAIVMDKEIFVRIHVRYCPSLDILDLPGTVAANARGAAEGVNLPELTRALAVSTIEQEHGHSIFLLINSCMVPAHDSVASDIILKDPRLADKTLGCFTKLDMFQVETGSSGDELECELRELISGTAQGSIALKNGWLGASSMIKADQLKEPVTQVARLHMIEENERLLYLSKFPRLYQEKLIGMQSIRKRVQQFYEKYICDTWISAVESRVRADLDILVSRNAHLGLPMPSYPEYRILVAQMLKLIADCSISIDCEFFAILDDSEMKELLKLRSKRVCSGPDWIRLPQICPQLHGLLTEMKTYHNQIPGGTYSLTEAASVRSTLVRDMKKKLSNLRDSLSEIGSNNSFCDRFIDALKGTDFPPAPIGLPVKKTNSFFGGMTSMFEAIGSAFKGMFEGKTNDEQANILQLGRRPDLVAVLRTHLCTKFMEASRAFSERATMRIEELDQVTPSPFVRLRMNIDGNTSTCSLQPGYYGELPESLIEMWIEDVVSKIEDFIADLPLDTVESSTKENIFDERKQILEKILSHLQVLRAIHVLKRNVSKLSGDCRQ